VLKLIPAGVELIPKLAMTPPVDEMVKPVAAVFTVLVSEEEERVKAGAVTGATTGAEVGATVGNWIGFGLPQSAGRLDKASIKILNEEYSTASELIIFPLLVLAEIEKL
jgi:hypothetical protein